MKPLLFSFCLCSALTLACPSLFALGKEPFFLSSKNELKIIVNNRILARVNDKAISVVDLQKKMDMIFYRQFPEYSSNVQARLQFYQVNWKAMLKELIDKELVLADAEENKVQISSGDVRQEMESLFGPNIIGNLEKAGLTYQEAWDLLKSDITLRRMLFFKVNSKAIKSVTPKEIKIAYDEWVVANPKEPSWKYQVVTIRGKNPTDNAELARFVHEELTENKTSLDEIVQKTKLFQSSGNTGQLTLSEVYSHSQKDISSAFKENLIELSPGDFSKPIAQRSKVDDSLVFRIFHVIEKDNGGAVPYAQIESTLKEKLLEKAMEREGSAYLEKLYKHFDVKQSYLAEMIPDDFQPFQLM